jgi:hypothetical protein
VKLRVLSEPPRLRSVRIAPKKVRSKTRKLTLTVSSFSPASLQVSGKNVKTARAAVGAKSRKVAVSVKPGKSTLSLRLTLRARGQKPVSVTVSVPRR